jgi:leucyl-tRNA synthetase
MAIKYDHSKIEKKWQGLWLKEKVFSPQLSRVKNPFYNLMMFPYPSAEGLHVGNMYAFTGADVYGRFNRMQGKDVFEPIGLDGFGIHSENYAIKVGKHPKEHAKTSEKHFYEQLHMIGNSFDWDRTLETYDPEYYKWTQWLFIQMFKKGLAYKDRAMVNWCPQDKTVLSDEQVIDEKCERCGSEVTKREMSSWFFKITKYADKLLSNIEKIDWPEKIKIAQRNWIGKSEGMLINFKKENGKPLPVFTTRPDTLNAVTFIVIADEKLYNEASKDKIGEFTDEYAIDPLSGKKLPIWKTNYVAPGYGTGNVMGVPAHDERDREFAQKYHLDIVEKDPDESLWVKVEKEGWGKKQTNYHLRDWGISRQRYWGPPIPMINCKDCGWQPVSEADLPVLLPDIKNFKPEGNGTSPLHNAPETCKKVKCQRCGA